MKTKFSVYKLVTPSFHTAVQYPETIIGQALGETFYPNTYLPSKFQSIIQISLVTRKIHTPLKFYWLRVRCWRCYR